MRRWENDAANACPRRPRRSERRGATDTQLDPIPDGYRRVFDVPEAIGKTSHHLCPGCGEAIMLQALAEVIDEEGLRGRAVCALGIGCYTTAGTILDIDIVQALHGRAAAVATGIKRANPDLLVFTIQGDGDATGEGALESFHAAARGEAITAIIFNNGGLMDTGCHITPTTLLNQITKNSPEGRRAAEHGLPVHWAETIASLDGAEYVARGSAHSAAGVQTAKKYVKRAFHHQLADRRYSLVEILTSCPTGWLATPVEALEWQRDVFAEFHKPGEIKTLDASARAGAGAGDN